MRKIALFLSAVLIVCDGLHADPRPNPRGGNATSKTATAADGLTNRNTKDIEDRAISIDNSRQNRGTSNRSVVIADRAGIRAAQPRATHTTRSAVNPVVRASTATKKSSVAARAAVRSATINAIANGSNVQVARSATPNTARATALFQNTAAIGTGYNECRESYFACMDQFCGLKSDTYRRCLCSQKFRDFKDKEDAFDAAKQLIVQFNDNNLNAIGLTTAEASAMYSASAGEAGMKTDTSGSAQMLANINDLLSGKKKATAEPQQKKTPTTLDLDFSSASEDIWGDGSSSGNAFSPKARSENLNVDNLEGEELYNAVNRQCMNMAEACQKNSSVGNMVVSAYTVLISQDCSAYEKKLDGQKTALESTIREANKAMMDARLDEFRSHNSASINDCIGKVRTSILEEYACGPNWKRCLDFSGLYINATTGDPIYSPQLFKLTEVINLNNVNDPDNKSFLDNLDKMKNRASSALGTCQDDAEDVWASFRQQALIEISQAQDEKIEKVKDSCVTVMKECYDKQSGQLSNFGKVEGNEEVSTAVSSSSGALSQRAARSMCKDSVLACAALYGDPDGCSVDDNGRVTDASGKKCGLSTLLAFVDTVDDTKISVMCKQDLEKYVQDLCTPEGGKTRDDIKALCVHKPASATDTATECTPVELSDYMDSMGMDIAKQSYPYKCKSLPFHGAGSVYEALIKRAYISCVNPETNAFDESGKKVIDDIISDLSSKMQDVLMRQCMDVKGQYAGKTLWFAGAEESQVVPEWAIDAFGSLEKYVATMPATSSLTFGEEGLNGTTTLKGSVVDTNMKSIISSASGATNEDLIPVEYRSAQGWGICMPATDKIMCERINAISSPSTVATYNDASRTCSMTDRYYPTLCGILPGGSWNETTKTCSYIPN
jgi:hypothetical protein